MASKSDEILWLSEADVDALLSPRLLIESLETAFLELAGGGIVERDAATLRIETLGANYVAYPACWPEVGLATIKVLTAVDSNGGRGRGLIDAVVVAIDAVTGRIRAIMDGRRITSRRTAAVSAIAARHLAAADAATLGIVGTGAQAIAHAESLTLVREFTRVLVASASGSADRAAGAANQIERRIGKPAEAVSVSELAASADVIACCSLSRTPLFTAGSIKADAVVLCVSRFAPDATEFDPAIARTASIVVADLAERIVERWAARPGAIGRPYDLMDLLAKRIDPPPSGHRVFLSGGRPFEDLVAARLVLDAAERRGGGLRLPHSRMTVD